VTDSAVPSRFTTALLREPLRQRLTSRAWSGTTGSSAIPSAVLVPLFEREGDVFLWFVRRVATMRRHGGQVAFPGGKADLSESPLDTALREAHEEIGLASADVDVLGRLDDRVTSTGFLIAPFIGWVPSSFTPVPNPAEVARVFSAPLRHFLTSPCGIPPFHGHTFDGERVWGVTGKILRDLVAVVRELEATS
jgi:8-oxo-dGTP pyrophosphatase MutT (NUDIX family)